MPEGPLGGPRPLTTGRIVVLITVKQNTQFELTRPDILKTDLINADGWGIVEDVDLDKSVRTYGIVTSLDAVELDELNALADDAKKNIEQLTGTGSVEGVSIGFK